MKTGRNLALLAVALFAGYAAAYRFTPRRYSYIGLDLEHARQFGHRWELYFYYPAGWVESQLIRLWPSLYNKYVQCPQIVVLEYWDNRVPANAHMYSFRFHSGRVPPPIDEIFPSNTDILDYVAKKNPGQGRRWPNGESESGPNVVTCKYYDCYLDEVEQYLSDKYPRPWTIEKALQWFKTERDPKARAQIVRLLSATRDPRAALTLGQITEGKDDWHGETFEVWATAHRELLHFMPMPQCDEVPEKYPVGLQGRGDGYEIEWFRNNKARLQKVCAGLHSEG